jgi:hypothetical protein
VRLQTQSPPTIWRFSQEILLLTIRWPDEDAQHQLFQDARETYLRSTQTLEVLMADPKDIADEIFKWSNEVIETPLEVFGGLPACPFARAAWERQNVMLHVLYDIDVITDIKLAINPFAPNVHICAWVDYDEMTADEFQAWIDHHNENHFGVWLMGFHPDSDENVMTPEFDGLVEDDYALVLVQSLQHLVEASDKLRRTSYYDAFSPEDMSYINYRKEIYDAWNEKISSQKAFLYQEEEAIN